MQRREFSLGLAALGLSPLAGCAVPAAPGAGISKTWNSAMEGIEQNAQGRLGVSMLDTETGLALGWRQDERFAMCSTFKLLLAGWMLSLVDQGREKLDARVHYAPADVVDYSPVSGPRAGTGGGLTVGELCSATVSLSDNTAANVLLERHGGPAALTRYLRMLGDPITRLDIRDNQNLWSIRRLCSTLDVHHSGYYAWLKKPISKTARENQKLSGLIKQFWLESGGVYGYRKIHYDLKDIGEGCGINRVHRLMKTNGLKSQRGYRKPRSQASTPSVIAANTLARQFNPIEPNQSWVTDINYIRTH